jgi:hypothetical protein
MHGPSYKISHFHFNYTLSWWAETAQSAQLRTVRSGDRISVGVRFSARIQTDFGAQTASCTMDTGYLFWG